MTENNNHIDKEQIFNDVSNTVQNENTIGNHATNVTPQPKKSTSLLYGLVGGLIGSCIVFGSNALMPATNVIPPSQTSQPSALSTQTLNTSSTTALDDNAVINAVSKVQDAVVSIANYQYQSSSSYTSSFFSNNTSKTLEKAGEGSGVIYKSEKGYAYIVTNNHVIEDAEEINVQLHDGTTIPGEVIGTDKLTDLAVVRVKNDQIKSVAIFANSDTVQTGQTVLAIGSPLGAKLASSVTKGIVSANKRSVEIDTNDDQVTDWSMETIQTDAAINPGNSGGALVDLNGQVIGINSMKISNTAVEGIGFAIPSNQVIDIINNLEQQGEVTRPLLGVSLVDLSDVSTSQRHNTLSLPSDVSGGVVISSVQQTGSAQAAGLKRYDVIVAIDNKPVTDLLSFRKALYQHRIGDTITVSIYREGELQETAVTLK